MRILMMNHNVAWSGGTFFRAYNLSRQMAKRGHEITLLTISQNGRFGFHKEMCDGVRVVQTPDMFWGRGRSGWDPWDAVNRVLFVRRESWDLVHAFDARPVVILPAVTLQRRGVPLIIDWADWWGRGGTSAERPGRLLNLAIGPIEAFFEEAFRPGADGNTVITTALYRRAVALGVRREALLHLIQGSDVEGIRPVEQTKARAALGIPQGVKLIGHLGVLYSRDADFLFSAFRVVRQELPDCNLVLIGRHRCKLDKYQLDAAGFLETGPVSHDHLVNYLAVCDILLLPLTDSLANRARWPSRVNDYLSAGRPVVATAVGDVAEMVAEHRAGIVVRPDAEEFAAAIVALLLDRDRREDYGQSARSLAETRLAWPLITGTLEEFYLRLLGSKVANTSRP